MPSENASKVEYLSEAAAQEVLRRAAAWEAERVDRVPVARLRQAALEAGIASDAFDAALAEVRSGAALSPDGPGRGIRARRPALMWRWLGLDRLDWPPPRWGTALVINVLAVMIGWMLLARVADAARAAELGWLAHKALDPVGLGLGALIAARLRARGATVLLAGMAVAAAVEVGLDALAGAPAVHGFVPHMALHIGGVIAVLLGAFGASGPPQGTRVPQVTQRAADSDAASAGPHDTAVRWIVRQRLGQVRHWLRAAGAVSAA